MPSVWSRAPHPSAPAHDEGRPVSGSAPILGRHAAELAAGEGTSGTLFPIRCRPLSC